MASEYRLNYPGNVAEGIIGRVVGPNLTGELFTITSAKYDPTADLTTASLRFARTEEVEMERPTRGGHV